jgi:hypothetical protein
MRTAAIALALTFPALARAETPKDFIAEAKLIYRTVACSGTDPLPAHLDPGTVEGFCKWLVPRIQKHRQIYAEGASAFLAQLQPAELPASVVYPFGGGDLLSALTTYPKAKEYTTISLEHAGDPRRIATISKRELATSLAVIQKTIIGLIQYDDSRTDNLMAGQRLDIPGQLAFFLVALAIHGYEPKSLRFFRLEPDGAIHYLSEEEIAALESKNAKLLKRGWVSPDFSEAFSNAELTFAKAGAPEDVRVHRHIAFNLDDQHLGADPSLLAHLQKKGRIAAMTKAASYLLWQNAFSKIRGLLLANMDFMISDSTGIPGEHATTAGFVQETYGNFGGSFLGASPKINEAFRELWRSQPQRPLPFRYGYVDANKRSHLLVTRRATAM